MKSSKTTADPNLFVHGSARWAAKRCKAGMPMYVCESGSSSAVCHSTAGS
jgi:hypothetical protein